MVVFSVSVYGAFGTAIDVLIVGRSAIYRAPAPAREKPEATISPLVTPDGREVLVSLCS